MPIDKDYHKILLSMENRITQLEKMLSEGVDHNFQKLFERMQLLEDLVRIDGEYEMARADFNEQSRGGEAHHDALKAFVDKALERQIARMKVTGEI